jgi:hypothetical protein
MSVNFNVFGLYQFKEILGKIMDLLGLESGSEPFWMVMKTTFAL